MQLTAWVVLSGGVQRVALGPAEPLEADARALLAAIVPAAQGARGIEAASTPPADFQGIGSRLRERLWGPIAPHLEGVRRVLIAPDGFLDSFPFEVLPDERGRFLVEDHTFAYQPDLGGLPELLLRARPQGASGVLTVGGVDFDGGAQEPSGVVSSPARGYGWHPLPFSMEEARSVAVIAGASLTEQPAVLALDGARATKASVRDALGGKRWIHLATHAFLDVEALRPPSPVPGDGWRRSLERPEALRLIDLMPGLATGLVCAGANRSAPATESAILTAEEISSLDLSACELVVLSGCGTALGERRGGEGMQSLRRAFALAGARTVIASSWSVGDLSTSRLMEYFYRRLWEGGLPKDEALRAAQLERIAELRAHDDWANPREWGAFLLSGDWR